MDYNLLFCRREFLCQEFGPWVAVFPSDNCEAGFQSVDSCDCDPGDREKCMTGRCESNGALKFVDCLLDIALGWVILKWGLPKDLLACTVVGSGSWVLQPSGQVLNGGCKGLNFFALG